MLRMTAAVSGTCGPPLQRDDERLPGVFLAVVFQFEVDQFAFARLLTGGVHSRRHAAADQQHQHGNSREDKAEKIGCSACHQISVAAVA